MGRMGSSSHPHQTISLPNNARRYGTRQSTLLVGGEEICVFRYKHILSFFQKGFAEDSQLDEIQQFFEQYGKVGMSPCMYPKVGVSPCTYPKVGMSLCMYPKVGVSPCMYPKVGVSPCMYPR